MTVPTREQDGYLHVLEEKASMLGKIQSNLKKCPKARLTKGYLQARLQTIEEHWKAFLGAHEALVKCTPREARGQLQYFLNEEFYVYEDLYLVIKADILDLLQSSSPQKYVNQELDKESKFSPPVKLPTIQLPIFSGKYEEFPTYEDLFTSLVHNNTSLSEVQKFHYLKTSVTGEVEALLRNIQITSANYIQAWELLKGRYGNKRLISNSLLKRLFNQKKIINQSATHIKVLLDTTSECLHSLKNLKVPIDNWDPLIVFLVVQRLDMQTHKEWEEHAYKHNTDQLPTWEELETFLETKYRTLELVVPTSHTLTTKDNKTHTQKAFHSKTKEDKKHLCVFCEEDHYLYKCKEFASLSVDDRHSFVREKKLCFNCLIPNHSVFQCKQQTSCRLCNRRHHSLLHREQPNRDGDTETHKTRDNTEDSENKYYVTSHYSRSEKSKKQVLLATALVNIISSSGELHVFRALVDQGSEASFVTSRVADLLRLKKTNIQCTVSGVGDGKQYIKHVVTMPILTKSKTPIEVKAYVMKTISSNLPTKTLHINWVELKGLTLADPSCCDPSKIDILLGADIFCQIIEDGLIRLQDGLIAQKTSLGWILSGQTNNQDNSRKTITSLHVREDNDMLKKFWEIETEHYTKKNIYTKEEEECEKIYKNTTKRHEDGSYIVHLPLKQSIEDTIKQIGDTKTQAIRRFQQLERKLEKNIELKQEYSKVIQEYLDMKHMKKINNKEINSDRVYLPHHAVIREEKDTTKVRVVYDASAQGSEGRSLNDTMMIGPVLQPDLRSLIICWRQHKICIIGDIVKMYRMVRMTEEHTKLQCIIWRNNTDEDLQSYKLETVTFGTASAPYLAVRTLIQLAEDESHEYPEAAAVIKTCFYMDDLMTGHDDLEKAIDLCKNIDKILKKGGFQMQKWSSNSDELLQQLSERKDQHILKEERESKGKLEIKMDKIIKILGLTWDRKDDTFKITVNLPEMRLPVTKRSILSDVARLFDPFGWLAPVVITAKTMIQRLWLCGLGWDEELPDDLVEEWVNYRQSLTYLQTIEIPRWLHTTSTCKEVQIHGFADASSISYAAVAYLKVIDEDDVVHISIVSSRTKVAPLKQLTIPRLELCAAALLAELIEDITNLIEVSKNNIFAYTDSMVVLSWLQSHPNRWKTFVANRVSDILRVLDNNQWRHVQSDDNPADIATRGVKACDMAEQSLWWTGPPWLKLIDVINTTSKIEPTDLEEKHTFYTNTEGNKNEEQPIWERFSTLSRMKRVLAYCRRVLKKEHAEIYLKPEELEEILQRCIKYYQRRVYEKEMEDIEKNGSVKKRSSLITLSPFLDKNGLMRVRGRLQNAAIADTMKHPIIVPKSQHITKLLIQEAHTKTLHGGIQAMMAYIHTKYWIIGIKAAVKKCIRMCKVCIIDKAKTNNQFMGQLPTMRVQATRAFVNSGVDYAGPVAMRTSKGRGHHATKGYICLFVCMATRAIHLEAVTDLTSQAFIAAFRRFVSRRGPCKHLWSDNGTNFVGSAKELKDLFVRGQSSMINEIAELLSNDGTTWHFIPPRMPNYGGIWEAGVQSAKRHLHRTIGATTLTYEEMATLLTQIEACLNSRPLCLLDNTTETLNVLTPGHFLVGEPLISVPDINYEERNINLLTRWQTIQRMKQGFWRRWQSEYLNTMQQRYKWQTSIQSPIIGDIVVIKEDGLPPTKWLLGKIIATHPGADNLVRVVTVQVKGNNQLKRPLSKVILLPKTTENC